jgi:hypothetical protein
VVSREIVKKPTGSVTIFAFDEGPQGGAAKISHKKAQKPQK